MNEQGGRGDVRGTAEPEGGPGDDRSPAAGEPRPCAERRGREPERRNGAAAGAPRSASVSDHLANERTYLAWIRTSIALISLGFVLAKFSVWLRELAMTFATRAGHPPPPMPGAGASLPAGLTMMAIGAILAVVARWRQRAVDRAIDADNYCPSDRLTLLLAVAIAAMAVVLIVFLLVTTRGL